MPGRCLEMLLVPRDGTGGQQAIEVGSGSCSLMGMMQVLGASIKLAFVWLSEATCCRALGCTPV